MGAGADYVGVYDLAESERAPVVAAAWALSTFDLLDESLAVSLLQDLVVEFGQAFTAFNFDSVKLGTIGARLAVLLVGCHVAARPTRQS